eukprot:TRINITY_DN3335_c0_g2_i1.p1 TRINITY_DN3335_c0_g2~~TRINITY_DN3335_c0_g2_i1.p1  ORF type:complete len:861 (-),score=160.56 TRINITY_DN3335_c0_g2_i1:97-2679(-)
MAKGASKTASPKESDDARGEGLVSLCDEGTERSLAEASTLCDDLFVLPAPALPMQERHEFQGQASFSWSLDARLPQLRVRADSGCGGSSASSRGSTPRLSPSLTPLGPGGDASPAMGGPSARKRSWQVPSPATRAQLREVTGGAEEVLNRLRYDLLSAEGFSVLIDNEEGLPLCRSFFLRGLCEYGSSCRHLHLPSLRWWGGEAPAPAGGSGKIAHVEALPVLTLFALLDASPSHTARYALLQTVAFILHHDEVVWCRDIGRSATQQLWERFVGVFRSGPAFAPAPRGDAASSSIRPAWSSGQGTALELLQALPGPIWDRILTAVGHPPLVSRAGQALLAFSGMRQSALGEDVLWEALAGAAWGASWGGRRGGQLLGATARDAETGCQLKARSSWMRYVALAADLEAAQMLSAVCGHVATPAFVDGSCSGSRAPRSRSGSDQSGGYRGGDGHQSLLEQLPCADQCAVPTLKASLDFGATALRGNASLLAAASPDALEVRLFQTSTLTRLPPLRLKGRLGVDAFDLAPENDALLVAATDGQISVHSISDSNNDAVRIGRVETHGSPTARCLAVPQVAGLHFLCGTGASKFVAAARGSSSAQLFDAARAKLISASDQVDSDGGLLACEAMGNRSVLLLGAGGAVRLWDARSPSLARVADLPRAPGLQPGAAACAVDFAAGAAAVACSAPASLHWVDLRAGRQVEARPQQLWPRVFGAAVGAAPVRVALARKGLVAVWFDAPASPITCYLGGGAALAPLRAGPAVATATAAARPFGGEDAVAPLVIATARPSRRKILFEVCSARSKAFCTLDEVAALTVRDIRTGCRGEAKTQTQVSEAARRRKPKEGLGRRMHEGRQSLSRR